MSQLLNVHGFCQIILLISKFKLKSLAESSNISNKNSYNQKQNFVHVDAYKIETYFKH